jgi:hypothetical protein
VSLLRGTAVENDEEEVARPRKLTPQKYMEIGFVLRVAILQEKASKLSRISELAKVS